MSMSRRIPHLPAWVLIVTAAKYLATCNAQHVTGRIDVHALCGQSYNIYHSIRITLGKGSRPHLTPYRKCMVTLHPQVLDILLAQVIHYEIAEEYVAAPGAPCPVQYMCLGGEKQKHIWGVGGYCQEDEPSNVYNLGKRGVFGYRTKFGVRIKATNVELLVTEVERKNRTDSCPDGFFDCGLDVYCINEDLVCDKYSNCPNAEDESSCGISMTIFYIVCVLITSLIVVAIVTVSIGKYLQAKSTKSTQEEEQAKRGPPRLDATVNVNEHFDHRKS